MINSRWRNRAEFPQGREEIIQSLTRKWVKELDYRLIKELWAFHENRIAVRFAYEWHDDFRNWFRSYGNENWEFDENGLMQRRFASINDLPIKGGQERRRLRVVNPQNDQRPRYPRRPFPRRRGHHYCGQRQPQRERAGLRGRLYPGYRRELERAASPFSRQYKSM
jgi:nuclear transport factor 2 (NTF2) superfamily protein